MRIGTGLAAGVGGALLLASSALAQVNAGPTINGDAQVDARGRVVTVSGTIECTAGERALLVVTVDSATGHASGKTRFKCEGGTQSWSVDVRAKGKDGGSFAPGEATVWATAWAGDDSDANMVMVELIGE